MMGAIVNVLLTILLCAYGLGAVALGLGHWLLELEDVNYVSEAVTWPIIKHSVIIGLLWPYYAYILLYRDS